MAYGTFEELVGYCDLSANPVGELVLHVFGAATPDRIALSDRVCTALQLAEHWQDVAEDRTAGRVYLPAEDLARFGVTPDDLDGDRDEPGRPGADGLRGVPGADAARRGRPARRQAPRARAGWPWPATSAVAGRRSTLSTPSGTTCSQGRREPSRARRARSTLSTYVRRGVALTAVALAYEHCRRVARESGSSFYAGMRLLPPDRRNALFAVYALARRIDDIADGDAAAEDKLEELAGVRAGLEHLDDGDRPGAGRASRRRRTASRFRSMRSASSSTEPSWTSAVPSTGRSTELERYCRCVAGSIGRLSLGVFDCSDRLAGGPLADELGIALQIGNILRDVSEDAANGRVYLPREDLERFGCRGGGRRVRRARSSS